MDELFQFNRDWTSPADTSRIRKTLVASVLLHIAAISLTPYFPSGTGASRDTAGILAQLRNPARLVAPPAELTQPAPNRAKPSKEFDLVGLLPKPRLELPPGPTSTTRPAASLPLPPSLAVAPPPSLLDPPKIEASRGGTAQAALSAVPQIQAEEKPKLVFERPATPIGSEQSSGRNVGSLRPPSGSISELGRELARGGRAGGLIVGDLGEGVGGLGEGLNLPPSPGRAGSRLELLSDPMGVDFRPYLIGILSAVRRNWFAVIPESAQFGSQGRVVLQFAINRDGSVPKLVIASPSGTQAFDRAAVAGVSASNPFPPLPSEYQGLNVRLQFVFLYNIR